MIHMPCPWRQHWEGNLLDHMAGDQHILTVFPRIKEMLAHAFFTQQRLRAERRITTATMGTLHFTVIILCPWGRRMNTYVRSCVA